MHFPEPSNFGDFGPGWTPRPVKELQTDLDRSDLPYQLDLDENPKQGGMGAVYFGAYKRDGKRIALKLLPHELAGERRYRDRFLDEIQFLQRLQHPNIIAIYPDAGSNDGKRRPNLTKDGYLFFVMPRLEGWTLAEILALPARQPVDRLVRLMMQICDGVQHAHTRQPKPLIHRDLKAANIFITTEDQAVILDFGVARDLAVRSTTHSREFPPGSPGHIAPELRSENPLSANQQSDVFSLGVVFFQMLMGQIPEGGHDWPSDAGLDPRWDKALKGALNHNVARRYRSAAEFKETIQALLEPAASKAKPVEPPPEAASAKPPPVPSPYVPGEIKLPFECVAFKILHDQVTAVVGGVDGRIAAIDLRTGNVICIAAAEDSTHRKSYQGAGENSYIANAYFFLELAPARQCFYTMSHSAVLKTWILERSFRLISSVSLIGQNFDAIRTKILKARRSGSWSTWTCYDCDIPEGVPAGIVDAKLSPDGGSILCLSGWFAIFRCDLSGRLRDEPMVMADAFNIEPASPDGSEVWVGRGSMGSALYRMAFGKGVISSFAIRASFGMHGIHALSPKTLYAGLWVVELPSLSELGSSDFSLGIGHRPLVLPEIRRVLAGYGSMVRVYDLDTLRADGEPLIAGHEGEIRAIDATTDRSFVVSLSARSLRVWDLKGRIPIGGYPPKELCLRHGLRWNSMGVSMTSDGRVYFCGYGGKTAVIDLQKKSVARINSQGSEIGAATGRDGEVHVVSLGKRVGDPISGAKGLLGRLFKVLPPDQHLLHHHVILSGGLTERATVVLRTKGYYDQVVSESVALDIGNGRVAVLEAGHLSVYDTTTKAIVSGPIDISKPSEEATGWRYYKQLAVSPDGLKLFARGYQSVIKVFNSINLSFMGDIQGSAGSMGLLVPWIDSRHLLFSGDDHLVIANAETGRMVGKLCELPYVSDSPNQAVLLGGGTTLALRDRLLDLTSGKWQAASFAQHAGHINSIHLCPGGEEIMTLSDDGTARFWNVRGRVEERSDALVSILARAQASPLGTLGPT